MPGNEQAYEESQGWVAIIDDDLSVRMSLSRLLRAHGIRAQPFASAEEFLGQQDQCPQCILLDVQLIGGLSGPDLCEQLASYGSVPPIIFMTGQDEIKPALLARFPELSKRLRKPFDTEKLILHIRNFLQSAQTT